MVQMVQLVQASSHTRTRAHVRKGYSDITDTL